MHAGRILVVDDEPNSRKALERLLRSEGYQVFTACDGERALEAYEAVSPDVVLTDLCMPVLDGIALCARLHALDPDLPVVVTTALERMQDAVESLRAGAVDYLVKPLDFDAVVWCVQRAIERRARRVEQEQHRVRTEELFQSARETVARYEHVLSVVAHDLRNPLGVIAIQAQRLKQAREGGVGEIAEVMSRSAVRMKMLLENLLEEARLRAGRAGLRRERHDLSEIVEDVRELRPLALVRRVELAVSAPEGPIAVVCDRVGIGQVLGNLVSNAIRFSPPNGVVSVDVDLDARRVSFSVRDQGPGIAPDALPQVFGRFWQGRPDEHAGLGLGLFVAKAITEAHGGTLEVESELRRGTTFRVHLPILAEDDDIQCA